MLSGTGAFAHPGRSFLITRKWKGLYSVSVGSHPSLSQVRNPRPKTQREDASQSVPEDKGSAQPYTFRTR